MSQTDQILRPHAEYEYAEELQVLAELDDHPRPSNWKLSPWAVVTYLLGGKLKNGFEIEAKYIGNRRLMEIAVATLATDRALMLLGIPGTAKTWVAEHLAAAISGDSTLLVQGTAGIRENGVRSRWKFARVVAGGGSPSGGGKKAVGAAMQDGKIARIEELTRLPSDVQDTLITILSEKTLPVPELNKEIQARRGFNIIATANDRDKGVNELSSALRRRFNTVVMPLPDNLEAEIQIVQTRVEKIGKALELPPETVPVQEIRRLVTIFRELRNGKTEDGRTRLKSPGSTLSTAEAISVINSGQALATHFGDGKLKSGDLAAGLTGAVVKDPAQDKIVWQEYLETIVRHREGWQDLYRACKELL